MNDLVFECYYRQLETNLKSLRSRCRTASMVRKRWFFIRTLKHDMRMPIKDIAKLLNRDISSINFALRGGGKNRKNVY